eukprot:COSAG06_NODE_2178_length_7407_cov_8.831554_6_plen_406_part_00
MMFGAIAGVIFSQISSMRTTQENYNARLTELKEFASARGLTKPLRLRLLAFHRFLYEGGTVFDEKAILSELPLHMQRDVVCECDTTTVTVCVPATTAIAFHRSSHTGCCIMFDADGIYGDLIMKSYFFLGIQHNDSAVMRICMELHATAALPGDDIYREGDIGDHMFFLLEGEVQQTTQCLELENDGSDQSKEEQEDEAAQKAHAQLIIKWGYSNVEAGGTDEVVFRNAFLDKGEKSGKYNAFREELGTVSGKEAVFCTLLPAHQQFSFRKTRFQDRFGPTMPGLKERAPQASSFRPIGTTRGRITGRRDLRCRRSSSSRPARRRTFPRCTRSGLWSSARISLLGGFSRMRSYAALCGLTITRGSLRIARRSARRRCGSGEKTTIRRTLPDHFQRFPLSRYVPEN